MIIQPTDETGGNVCANNNKITITLNISLSINGVKYGVCGSNDGASTNTDDDGNDGNEGSENSIKSIRICTKANPNLSLTIRDEKVCMTKLDSSDRFQYWYKYTKYSAGVTDKEKNSSFVLVNKATGQAIQHSDHDQDVKLIKFNENKIDYSVLWTCKFTDDSYMYIRNINNIDLLFDAWNGNGDGIHDGTKVILWKFQTGHNQLWKFVPFG